MKSKSTSRTAFFKLRASIIAVFCLTSVSVALVGSGAFSVGVFAQTNTVKANSFTPEGCFWSPGPDMPTTLIRAVGVYFTDGNFYVVGGSTSDTPGSDFQHVLQLSAQGSFSWSQMSDTLPDNQVNDMACGVLTVCASRFSSANDLDR